MAQTGIPASTLPMSDVADDLLALARRADGVVDLVRMPKLRLTEEVEAASNQALAAANDANAAASAASDAVGAVRAWASAGAGAAPVSTNGLDFDFRRDVYAAANNGPTFSSTAIAQALALPGVAFARASQATVWNAAGALETVAANAPQVTHDAGTGANQRLRIEAPSTNRLRNPEWSGLIAGTLTSNVAFADNGVRAILSNITAATVASGVEHGMNYAEFTLTGGASDGTIQIQLAEKSGANSIATAPGDVLSCWAYLKCTAGAAGTYNALWRVSWYNAAGSGISTYSANPAETANLPLRTTLYPLTSGGSVGPATAPANTATALPYIQITVKAGQTATFRVYLCGLEPGAVISSPIRAWGAWPYARAAGSLTFTTASLPVGVWSPSQHSIAADIALIGAATGDLIRDAGGDAVFTVTGQVTAAVRQGATQLSATAAVGSLRDGAPRTLVYQRSSGVTTLAAAGGVAVTGATAPADLSAIRIAPAAGGVEIGRLAIRPASVDLAQPYAAAASVIAVDVAAGNLYATTSSGRTAIVTGGTEPVMAAQLLADGRILATRQRAGAGGAVNAFYVAPSGVRSIPVGRGVVHSYVVIAAQSWAAGMYAVPPLGTSLAYADRALMPLMTSDGDVRCGSQRGGTGADGYFDPANIVGLEALVERVSTRANFNAGETGLSAMAAAMLSDMSALDRGDGPALLFVNLGFSGTRIQDHGPTPVSANLGAGLTPPKGPYFDLDRGLTKLHALITASGRRHIVAGVVSEIGWNDQADGAAGQAAANRAAFVTKYIAAQTAINAKIAAITGQTAAPKWLAMPLCTREATALTATDLAHIDLQQQGKIKIAGPAYSVWPIGFYTDGLHDTPAGRERKGLYFARAALAEIYGEGWWPTIPKALLPSPPGGTVRRVGAQIQIDFNCPVGGLTLNGAVMGNPAQAGLVYREGGAPRAITGVSVAGQTLTLTFAANPAAGVLSIAADGIADTFGDNAYTTSLVPRTSIGDAANPPNYCPPCEVTVA